MDPGDREATMGRGGRQEKIRKIIEFVKEHEESQATRAVLGRIFGRYDMEVSDEVLRHLEKELAKTGDDEIESLYTIIS